MHQVHMRSLKLVTSPSGKCWKSLAAQYMVRIKWLQYKINYTSPNSPTEHEYACSDCWQDLLARWMSSVFPKIVQKMWVWKSKGHSRITTRLARTVIDSSCEELQPRWSGIAELYKRISMATGQGVPLGACGGSIITSAINGNMLSDILKSL